MQGQTFFFFFFVKLIEFIFSALSVCSNSCVRPLPGIEISFFLLSIFVHELISTPKIITFLPNPVPENEKRPCLSNPIPYPDYSYLPILAFLVNLAPPNKTIFWCWIVGWCWIILLVSY